MNNHEYKSESIATVRAAEVVCCLRLDEMKSAIEKALKDGPIKEPELHKKAEAGLKNQLALINALIGVRSARWAMTMFQSPDVNDANSVAANRFLAILRS